MDQKSNRNVLVKSSRKIWVAVSLVTAILIMLASLVVIPKTDLVAQTVPSCGAADITMALGMAEGAAGTTYQHIIFKNHTTHSCTFIGYPAAFLYSSANYSLGNGAAPNPAFLPTIVTLAPGARAHIALGLPHAANFPAGTCTANAQTLRVYVPGHTSYLHLALAQPWCPGFSVTSFIPGV